MSRYMLDTNTVSHAMKQHANVIGRLVDVPMALLCVSSITIGELMYGLEKRPDATRLRVTATEFLRRVEVLPWEHETARLYGMVRAEMERQGKPLGSLDLLIASHALAVGAVLVTSDHAFGRVAGLHVEDWTVDGR